MKEKVNFVNPPPCNESKPVKNQGRQRYVVLFILMFVFACGSGSEDPLEQPSGSPPEETPEPVVLTCQENEIKIDIDDTPTCVGTKNLYSAEQIDVFYTDFFTNANELSFKDLLSACMQKGIEHDFDASEIGLLNGKFAEEGYTKDFFLDPNVERSWSRVDITETSSGIAYIVDQAFKKPLSGQWAKCTTANVSCKQFLCGAIKGN